MSTIDKPKPDAKGRYKYWELMRFLEAKYGFKANDYNKTHDCYGPWCDKHGKPRNSPDIKIHQQVFREYSEAPDGMAAEPPYANFWHWMLDLVRGPNTAARLTANFRLDIPKVLATYDTTLAVQHEAEQERMRPLQELAFSLFPADVQQMARQQNKPTPTKLQPFVKDILGYIQLEFGPVVKLDMRKD